MLLAFLEGKKNKQINAVSHLLVYEALNLINSYINIPRILFVLLVVCRQKLNYNTDDVFLS